MYAVFYKAMIWFVVNKGFSRSLTIHEAVQFAVFHQARVLESLVHRNFSFVSNTLSSIFVFAGANPNLTVYEHLDSIIEPRIKVRTVFRFVGMDLV